MIVPVEGAELVCTTRGAGLTCLVPSAIGAPPYERQMPERLDRHLRLAFVELRGSGRSTGDPGDLTFERLADDLDAVRAALGAERVAVIGHSILGALAIEYARRRPAAVSHVVVAGAPPTGDMRVVAARATEFFARDASEERKRLLEENLARLPPGATMGEAMLAQTPMRFFDERTDAAPLFAGADASGRLVGHVLRTLTASWDVGTDARAADPPLLIVHGRHDYVVPYTMWEGIVERLPRATMEVFARSGHQPFHEEAARFAEVVEDWLGLPRG
jgi:proline iminopeptidase